MAIKPTRRGPRLDVDVLPGAAQLEFHAVSQFAQHALRGPRGGCAGECAQLPLDAPHQPEQFVRGAPDLREPGFAAVGVDARAERGREGFDAVTWWARSGLMDLVRAQGAPPGGSTPGMGDHPTAVSMYAMIVTALMRRERTGKGSHVHTSLLHNGIWSNACHAQAAFSGAELSPLKAERPPSPNRTPFLTRDGRYLWLYMVRTQEELDDFCVRIGRPELADDTRFTPLANLTENKVEATALLREVFAERDLAEWMAAFREHNVPVVPIAEVGDLPDDPQVKAAGIISPPADPSVPAQWVINHPMHIDGMPTAGIRHAPEVGEHTADVLSELGYDAAAIAAFRDEGAI